MNDSNNRKDEDGNTLLRKAILKEQTDMIRVLIDNGADVNKANKYGHTPLDLVPREGHVEIAKILRDHKG